MLAFRVKKTAVILSGVRVRKSNISDYRSFNRELGQRVIDLAEGLRGRRVVHINATPKGGGVAEMLKGQVALERDLGLDSRWLVLGDLPLEFFETTKKIHNLLQGKGGALTEDEKSTYLKANKEIAGELKTYLRKHKTDVLVVHDPQPLAAIGKLKLEIPSLLRLHIDLSTPNAAAFRFFEEFVILYDLVALSRRDYKPPWLPAQKLRISYPAIDPLAEKNKIISKTKAQSVLRKLSIDTSRPVATQVSRFDPWKDPIGVVEAYRRAKKSVPELQLALAGFMEAQDDPEAVRVIDQVRKEVGSDPDVFLFSDLGVLKGTSHALFINALQRASDVVLQKSIREGFGLTVTEAMWKYSPVVGGRTEGIEIQIDHGKSGFLVDSPQEAAEYMVKLISNPSLRRRMGKAAHESVEEKFLIVRLIEDYLKTYRELLEF